MVVSNIFYFHPHLGKIPILTNFFQMGWNHHLDKDKPNLQWRSVFFKRVFHIRFHEDQALPACDLLYKLVAGKFCKTRHWIGLCHPFYEHFDLSGIVLSHPLTPIVLLADGWFQQQFWGWGLGTFGESLSSTFGSIDSIPRASQWQAGMSYPEATPRRVFVMSF